MWGKAAYIWTFFFFPSKTLQWPESYALDRYEVMPLELSERNGLG